MKDIDYSLYNSPTKSSKVHTPPTYRQKLVRHVGLYLLIVIPGLIILGLILSQLASR